MKKSYLFIMAAVAMLFTACDPVVDKTELDPMNYTADELANAVTFKVYKDEACTQEAGTAEGNWVKFTTNPGAPVTILQYPAGAEKIYAVGSEGVFNLAPKRGESTDQVLTIRVVNSNNEAVETTKTVSVYVNPDLDPELKLLLGEAGVKEWGWAEDGYEVWGNAGNSGGGDAFTAYNVDGKWWGVTESAELANSQMAHCAGDEANGAKYAATGSYMRFDEEGSITAFTADGEVIGDPTTYKLSDYDPTRASGWQIATLTTAKPAVLWPYSINENGKTVTQFDVMYLDANHMTLVYTKGNTAGSWGEITYWRFKNLTPSKDALEAQPWYWASDGYECWGNAGNSGDGSAYKWNNVDGKWWGVTSAADLSGQMQHSGDGNLADADDNAYMIFKDGTVTSYGSDGTAIRSSDYTLDYTGRVDNWAIGTLETTKPALLFPWSINEGGVGVTKFDLMQWDGGFMTLVYTKGNGSGSWAEITYWRFSTKH